MSETVTVTKADFVIGSTVYYVSCGSKRPKELPIVRIRKAKVTGRGFKECVGLDFGTNIGLSGAANRCAKTPSEAKQLAADLAATYIESCQAEIDSVKRSLATIKIS